MSLEKARVYPTGGRNRGIDLLRLVSMFYVVLLHTLTQGGVLAAAPAGAMSYRVSWLLFAWTQSAVDIFALISGYVTYTDREKPVNYAGYFTLWLQAVFYGLAGTLVTLALRPQWVGKWDLFQDFFPATGGRYWYFTSYTGLFALMPLLNAGLRKISRRTARSLFFAIILVFSLMEMPTERFYLVHGYSPLWIILLYLLGSIVKKCRIGERVPPVAAAGGIVALTVGIVAWKDTFPTFRVGDLFYWGDIFITFTSPAVLTAALLHLFLFSRLSLPRWLEKAVDFCAPGAFAAYLLNTHMVMWDHVLPGRFAYLGVGGASTLLAVSLGFSLAFVAASVLIDRLRQALFRLLHVRQGTERFACWLRRTVGKL